jgi:hypothetical protein
MATSTRGALALAAALCIIARANAASTFEVGGLEYRVVAEEATYAEARVGCAALGMTLAKLSNKADGEEVHEGVRSAWGGDVWYWIGLSDLQVEGKFVWEDGTSPSYTNWGSTEPSKMNGLDPEDCVYVGLFDWNSQWNDAPCAILAPAFVCSKRAGELPRTSNNSSVTFAYMSCRRARH